MEKIEVTVEGNTYSIDRFSTIEDFIKQHMSKEYLKIILAFRDKKLCELRTVLDKSCELELVTATSVIGYDTYRRSLKFLMLKSFSDILGGFTKSRINIMYTLGKGLYSKSLVKGNVTTDEAIKRFKKQGMADKEKLFSFRRVSKVNIYSMDGYEDYFYGYMVPSTGYLKYFDLLLYDEGFLLMCPSKEQPDVIPAFKPQEKLFNVLKTSDMWSKMLDVDNVGDLNEAIKKGEIRELMLVQEALMEKQIAQIADMILQGNKKIVLIAGPSSSGKTTFSHRLSVQLRAHGLRPYPLALDNYFLEREHTPKDENGNYDFECIEAMDLNLFNSDMIKLLDGEEIQVPTFNFTVGKKEYKGKTLKLNEGDVLVAEGIHALNPLMTSKLPDESKFKVYISALTQLNIDEHNRIPTTDGRLIRRIVRDARTRGNDARATNGMWSADCSEQEGCLSFWITFWDLMLRMYLTIPY